MTASYDPALYAPASSSGNWVSETKEQFGGKRKYVGTKRNCWVDGRQSCLRPPVFVHVRNDFDPRKTVTSSEGQSLSTPTARYADPTVVVPVTLPVVPAVHPAPHHQQDGSDASLRPAFHAYKVDTQNVLPPRAVRNEAVEDFDVTVREDVGVLKGNPHQLVDTSCVAFHCNPHHRVANVHQCRGCRFCGVDAMRYSVAGATNHASNAERAAEYARRTAELRQREAARRLAKSQHVAQRSSSSSCAKNASCLSCVCVGRASHCPICHKTKLRSQSRKSLSPQQHHRETMPEHGGTIESGGAAFLQQERRTAPPKMVGTDLSMCASCSVVMRYVPKARCPDCGGKMVHLFADQDAAAPHRRATSSSPTRLPFATSYGDGAVNTATTLGNAGSTHEISRAARVDDELSGPMKELLEHVRTLPVGVVPLQERRTALGERIVVGRARVPQSTAELLAQEAASRPSTVAVTKWTTEPVDSNDSTRIKSCLTWR